MHGLPERTIVVNSRSCINDDRVTHDGICVDYSVGHYNRAAANSCIRADIRAWVHYRDDGSIGILQAALLLPPNLAISDGYHYAIELMNTGEQRCHIADNCPVAVFFDVWPGVIKKHDIAPTRCDCGIGNNLAMATGTE